MNENIAFQKVFPFGEGRYQVEFASEFINIFNRHAVTRAAEEYLQ